jgi:hypothetical protein
VSHNVSTNAGRETQIDLGGNAADALAEISRSMPSGCRRCTTAYRGIGNHGL